MKVLNLMLIGIFLLNFLSVLSQNNDKCEEVFYLSKNEGGLIGLIQKNVNDLIKIEQKCLEFLLTKGEYKAANALLSEMGKLGLNNRENLRIVINKVIRRLEDVTEKYRFNSNDAQIVQPAFQWAQSNEDVYIEIKYAHRKDAPGCLEVKEKVFNFVNGNKIEFSAFCVQGDVPIKFDLNLEFFDEFDKDKSVSETSSVGKMNLILHKKSSGFWPRLLKSEKMPWNMSIWWEMREKFQDDLSSFEENESNTKTKQKKKKKKQRKSPPETNRFIN